MTGGKGKNFQVPRSQLKKKKVAAFMLQKMERSIGGEKLN